MAAEPLYRDYLSVHFITLREDARRCNGRTYRKPIPTSLVLFLRLYVQLRICEEEEENPVSQTRLDHLEETEYGHTKK